MLPSPPNCPFLNERHRLGLWDEVVINDNPTFWLQAWDRRLQNFDHVLIRPVMEYHAEKEGVGLHGLIVKEIVLHEFNPWSDMFGYGVLGALHRTWKVLNYEMKARHVLSECSANVPLGTSDIDNCSGAIADRLSAIAFSQQRG